MMALKPPLAPSGRLPNTVEVSGFSWTLTSSYTIYFTETMPFNDLELCKCNFFLPAFLFWQDPICLTWLCLAVTSFMKPSLTLPDSVAFPQFLIFLSRSFPLPLPPPHTRASHLYSHCFPPSFSQWIAHWHFHWKTDDHVCDSCVFIQFGCSNIYCSLNDLCLCMTV